MEAISLPIELLAIQAVEDSFVAAIKASIVGPLLAQCDSLPADLSPAEIGIRLAATPGAFVKFGGGSAVPQRRPVIDGKFTVFAVTGQGANEEQRRRGSVVAIGAYSLVQAVATALHGVPLPTPSIGGVAVPCLTIGAPQLTDITPYWTEALDDLGLSIYGATFDVRIDLPPAPTEDDIADFRVFVSQILLDQAVAGGGSSPLPNDDFTGEDVVILPMDDPELGEFVLGVDTLS